MPLDSIFCESHISKLAVKFIQVDFKSIVINTLAGTGTIYLSAKKRGKFKHNTDRRT